MDVPMTPQSIQIASLHQVSPQAVQIAADYEQQQMSSPTQTETDRRTGDMKQLLTGGTIDVQHLQQSNFLLYATGGSLERYGRIPEEILGRLAVRIIEGLLYMWSLKVLHRDIKPSNILVNTKGDVKLCDFGVSTQLVKSIAITYVGTNAYMALATGEFPFQEMVSKSNRTPVLPQDVFSPELSDFVARCMQKDPDRRITQINVLGHPLIQKYLQDRNISKFFPPRKPAVTQIANMTVCMVRPVVHHDSSNILVLHLVNHFSGVINTNAFYCHITDNRPLTWTVNASNT
ncbi:MP2K5-like protein [Mya arenaria]|uniref:mitogen-activated protein kinase kinase n=1 Tax=Mya arenaria TaxID=6604 RepID=A0ABY7E8W4_MYAAR|nr:MP2K5-like protein [Mya arenaria]